MATPTSPDPTTDDRPRRSPDAVLHEVTSRRDGTRYVLEQRRTGAFLELPRGEHDAFLWARLDGDTSLERLAADYFREFDSLPPDLGGLVQLLRDAGMLEGQHTAPPPPSPSERAAAALRHLAFPRLPLPGTATPLRLLGRLLGPLSLSWVSIGLVLVALYASLQVGGGLPLIQPPADAGPLLHHHGSLRQGILLLLAINLALGGLEVVARAAVLGWRGRGAGPLQLGLDLGLPNLHAPCTDAAVLGLERRLGLALAPVYSSLIVLGASLYLLGNPLPNLPLDLTYKVAWIGVLRLLAHLNPLGPSPLYDTLRAWWELPRLRRAATRVHTLPAELRGTAYETRLVLYLAASILYLVALAKFGTFAFGLHVEPIWADAWEQAARADASTLDAWVLWLPLLSVALPIASALITGLVLAAIAGFNALASSGLASTPARRTAALAALTLGVAAATPLWPPEVERLALPTAATLAAALGLLLARRDARLAGRRGVGAHPFSWLGALGVAALVALLGTPDQAPLGPLALSLAALLAATTDATRGVLPPVAWLARVGLPLTIGGAAMGLDASGLLTSDWGSLPLLRAATVGFGLCAAFAAPWTYRVLEGATRRHAVWPLGLAGLAAAASASSPWLPHLTAELSPAAVERACALVASVSAALGWAAAGWGRRRAPLPPQAHAEPPERTALARLEATLRFLVEAVVLQVRAEFGVSTAAALVRSLGAHQVVWSKGTLRDGAGDADNPPARGERYAEALETLIDQGRRRVGENFVVAPLTRAVDRLPERGQLLLRRQILKDPSHMTLEPLRAALKRSVPHTERVRLLRNVAHFVDFDPAELVALSERFETQTVQAGEIVFRQGDEGDRSYVIARGSAAVYLRDDGGTTRQVARLAAGDGFGEGALLRHERRSATVVMDEDGVLLSLERGPFSEFVRGQEGLLRRVFARQEDLELLRETPLFSDMQGGQVGALFRRLRPLRAQPGQVLMKQGELGDRFFLIREGGVRLQAQGQQPAELERGGYFGEVALLNDAPRAATAVTTGPAELLTLSRRDFEALLPASTTRELTRRSLQRLAGGAQ